MTKGRKLRPCRRCFAPGRMPFEQSINSRLGFDISVSRFAADETAIVKQVIEAMSYGPARRSGYSQIISASCSEFVGKVSYW